MLGAFEDKKSSTDLDRETDAARVSLEDDADAKFFGAFTDRDGPEGFDDLEGFEEPATPLREIGAFLSGLVSRKNLPWLAIRVIPVALVLIAGLLFWPSSEDDVNVELSILTSGAPTPQVELAEIAPGLSYTARNPQLLVDLGQGGIASADDGADDPAAEDADELAEDAAESDSPEEATSTTAENGSTGPAEQTTTTDGSANAQATTTDPPATEAPATTPPTTAATTTTETPTTPAPTTPPTTTPPTSPPTDPPPPPPSNNCSSGGEFERVFRDDFNGSSVGSGWNKYNSAGNAGYGLRRPSAITARDGKLVITARMENGSLVSGGMSNSIHQTYGKYVIRVRTDNDPSQAVSGVVLTWPSSGQHPRDGENNIYETLVQTPNRNPFFTFIHKPFGSHSDQEYKQHFADGSQFQTMTMEWTPDRITIIREGPGNNGNYDAWTVNETGADLIPDVSHHMTIQLDGWKHSIGGDVRMEVDFVEIYKYCG